MELFEDVPTLIVIGIVLMVFLSVAGSFVRAMRRFVPFFVLAGAVLYFAGATPWN